MSTRELCLRWTVDPRIRPTLDRPLFSSAVRCRGGEWRLCYFCGDGYHFLCLRKVVFEVSRPDPFDVSVQVEGGGTKLSYKRRYTHNAAITSQEGKIYDWHIWGKSDSEVERRCLDFRRDLHLRFVVVIGGGDAALILTDDTPACPLRSSASSVDRTAASQRGDPCLESLSEDLCKILDQGSQPVVEFLCAGQSTKAHGAVVSARSPVIAAMLLSDMVEGKTRVIKIPDMEPEVFGHFIRYLYTGKVPELTFEVALKLYESGDQYGADWPGGVSSTCWNTSRSRTRVTYWSLRTLAAIQRSKERSSTSLSRRKCRKCFTTGRNSAAVTTRWPSRC